MSANASVKSITVSLAVLSWFPALPTAVAEIPARYKLVAPPQRGPGGVPGQVRPRSCQSVDLQGITVTVRTRGSAGLELEVAVAKAAVTLTARS
jgi:hypothetical protein